MRVIRDRISTGRFRGVDGIIRGFERPASGGLWRPVFEADNVILNAWYVTLMAQLGPEPLDSRNIGMLNLALGYGVNPGSSLTSTLPPVRTDTGLLLEWSTVVALLTSARTHAGGPYTDIAVTALPFKIASAATLTLNGQTLTLTADASPGDTSISVASFTPVSGHDDPIGTGVVYSDPSIVVPQRLAAVVNTTDPSDPPSTTISFFLPAASNSEPITFTEAGLLYATNTVFGSHVAFAYTKGGNTDLRVDYTLARESDE